MTTSINSNKRPIEGEANPPKKTKTLPDFEDLITSLDPSVLAIAMLSDTKISDLAIYLSVSKRMNEIAQKAFIQKAKLLGYEGSNFSKAIQYIQDKLNNIKRLPLIARFVQIYTIDFSTQSNPELELHEMRSSWEHFNRRDLTEQEQGHGGKALAFAAFFNRTTLVALLLDHKVSPNLKIMFRSPLSKCEALPTPLQSAVLKGNLESAKKLIECEATVNLPDIATLIHTTDGAVWIPRCSILSLAIGTRNNTPFSGGPHISYLKNSPLNIPMLRFLLENGAKIKTEDVISAAKTRSVEALLLLLNHGAEFNEEVASRALTALVESSIGIDFSFDEPMQQMLTFLCERGANIQYRIPYSKSKLSQPILALAIRSHSLELVQFLVKKGADIAATDQIAGLMPVIITDKNRKLAEYLIENGANINRQNKYEKTVLHEAVTFNSLESVRFLVEHGADPLLSDIKGTPPFHLAAQIGKLEILRYFLDQGTPINQPDAKGNTPLTHAYYSKENDQIVELLLSRGASFPSTFKIGQTTPLHVIARTGNFELLQNLGELTIDVENPNSQGNTALHLACANGTLNVVEYLIQEGANVTVANQDRLTPLHLAVKHNHPGIFQLLLKQPGYANFQETEYSKPLVSLAVSTESLELVQAVVRKGFDVNLTSDEHLSPLCKAAYRGKFEIVKFLLEKGANVDYIVEFGEIGKEFPHTALTLACYSTTDPYKQKEFSKIVSILLRYGAPIILEDADFNEYSALELAKEEKNDRIVEILEDHIALTQG